MSCPKTELISAYLDNELGLGEQVAFEAHMQGCNRCSRSLEEMRSLHAAFANRSHHQAPYGFATRVMARTAELEKKKAPFRVPLFVRFAEAAVLVVVITLGIIAGKVMTNGSASMNATSIASSLSLDMFDATPAGSPGGAYLAMMEARNEK